MSLAFEKRPEPTRQAPGPLDVCEDDFSLEVEVIFTSIRATVAALKHAGALAARLGARIRLVVPQIVPYPLPLNKPPVARDFNERRFRALANESAVETTVHVYLCRDQKAMLSSLLKPHSLIVIGGYKRMWPGVEKRLARKLRRSGHEVVLIEA